MVGTIAIRWDNRRTDFTKGYKEEIVENHSRLYLEGGMEYRRRRSLKTMCRNYYVSFRQEILNIVSRNIIAKLFILSEYRTIYLNSHIYILRTHRLNPLTRICTRKHHWNYIMVFWRRNIEFSSRGRCTNEKVCEYDINKSFFSH